MSASELSCWKRTGDFGLFLESEAGLSAAVRLENECKRIVMLAKDVCK
jgi:hypothetical protein